MTRRAFLVVVGQALPLVQLRSATADVVELFGSLAAALSEADAAEFLRPFDRNMPDYGKLRANVSALLEQAQVSSSTDITSDEGDDRRRKVTLDWMLDIRAGGAFERRRQDVACTIERRKDRWAIVELKPVEFFAPPALTE